MRRSHLPYKSARPRRRGRFRMIKFIIVAAILGSIFRVAAPSVGLYSSSESMKGSGSSIFGGGGGIGGIGSSYSFGGVVTLRKKDATPLIRAAIAGDKDEVKKILRSEVSINGRDSNERTAIIGAAYHEQNEMCVYLIEKGADPYLKDNKGFNALDFAAARGLVKTVRLLLRETDSSDTRNHVQYAKIMQAVFAIDTRLLPKGRKKFYSVNRLSPEDKSPLHVAASSGSVDMVSKLIKHGAKVNFGTSNKQTALHWAAWGNRILIMAFLLEKSAEIDATDSVGTTPLMLAVQANKKEAVILLLQRGADKNIRNEKGKNATDIAIKYGFNKITSILQNYVESHELEEEIEHEETGEATTH